MDAAIPEERVFASLPLLLLVRNRGTVAVAQPTKRGKGLTCSTCRAFTALRKSLYDQERPVGGVKPTRGGAASDRPESPPVVD